MDVEMKFSTKRQRKRKKHFDELNDETEVMTTFCYTRVQS